MIVSVSDREETRDVIGSALPGISFHGSSGLTNFGSKLKDRPDIFIIEKELAWADGFIAIDYLRTQPHLRETPIILLTQSMTQSEIDEHQFSAQGVAGYLTYPYDREALVSLVKQLAPLALEAPVEAPVPPPYVEVPTPVTTAPTPTPTMVAGPTKEPTAYGPIDVPVVNNAPQPTPSMPMDPTIFAQPTQLEQMFDPQDNALDEILNQRLIPTRSENQQKVFVDAAEEVETLQQYVKLLSAENQRFKSQLDVVLSEKNKLQSQIDQQHHHLEKMADQIQEMTIAAKTHENQVHKVSAESFKQIAELRSEVDRSKFQASQIEEKLQVEMGKVENMKEKIQQEQKRLRVRERELENKLELCRQDAEETINRRNIQILELRRRVEALEFELSVRGEREQELRTQWEDEKRRLLDAATSVRSALQILQPDAP